MSSRHAGFLGAVARTGSRPTAPAVEEPLIVCDVLCRWVVDVATAALAKAELSDEDMLGTGCVLADRHGTAATAEYIVDTLDSHGLRWLDPRGFLYYSPHAVTGELCIRLGLGGPVFTLLGRQAQADALGYAALLVRTGRCDHALVVSVDWATEYALAALGDVAARPAEVVAVVLSADRGWARVGNWSQDADGGQELAGLAGWRQDSAEHEFVVSAGSARVELSHVTR